MKKTKLILLSLGVLLCSCGNNSSVTTTITSTTSSSVTTTTSSSSSTSTGTSTSSTTSSTSSTSTSTSSSSTSSSEDPWFNNREKLACGYYEMDLPKNHNNPVQLITDYQTSSWYNFDMKSEMPNDFRYIYRNSCDDGPTGHKSSPKFYSNEAGGLKIANTGVGFQTYMFSHTGEKLEMRIGISQVNNCSETPEKGKDTLHIYYFNKFGDLLGYDSIEEGSISKSSEGQYVKLYCTHEYVKDIAYIDIRCNALAYKGSQCYNIGIGYFQLKSWPQA